MIPSQANIIEFLSRNPQSMTILKRELSQSESAIKAKITKLKNAKYNISDFSIDNTQYFYLNNRDYEMTILMGDQHIPHHDADLLSKLEKTCFDYQPDTIVLGGDFADCYYFSNFAKAFKNKTTVQEDLNLAKAYLEKLRKVVPNARIVYIEGNHEARMKRYEKQQARDLAGADIFDITKVLDFKKNKVEFIPMKDGKNSSIELYPGIIVGHFDKSLTKGTMSSLLEKYVNKSVLQFHTHRISSVLKTGFDTTLEGYEVGCLCATQEYVANPNWQQGFGYLKYYPQKKQWFYNQVTIKKGNYHIENRYY